MSFLRTHRNLFEAAVLVTNDSDLLEAVKNTKSLGKRVGVLNPHQHQSKVLALEATFSKPIRGGPLGASHFPVQLTDAAGTFRKPLVTPYCGPRAA
jgi:uncharacterized LabA/DUF88 family protein